MKSGPIIIIEDDTEDKGILEEILRELQVTNPIRWFTKSPEAFLYLAMTVDQPFIIFCDINLPGQTGIEFKRQLDANPELRNKSIPFVFYSTSIEPKLVREAYTEMTVQGFFQKKNSYSEIRESIKLIIDYWRACIHPNME